MHVVRLPAIHNDPSVTTQGDLSPNAQLFAQAWMTLLGKRADIMIYDSRLAQCAQDHAEYLCKRTGDELLQSMHRGNGGSYPNDRVLDAGYRLPRGYDRGANNVESCARDGGDPATVLVTLAGHETHYAHMHCVNGFEWHIYWGVGNCGDDYVALTAPPMEVI